MPFTNDDDCYIISFVCFSAYEMSIRQGKRTVPAVSLTNEFRGNCDLYFVLILKTNVYHMSCEAKLFTYIERVAFIKKGKSIFV